VGAGKFLAQLGGMVTLLRDHAAVTGEAPFETHGHAKA
jgi:hypothetical protein